MCDQVDNQEGFIPFSIRFVADNVQLLFTQLKRVMKICRYNCDINECVHNIFYIFQQISGKPTYIGRLSRGKVHA